MAPFNFAKCLYRRDVTHFLADYKGAEPGQPFPAKKPNIVNAILGLHKPVSDWLETLPHRISELNM